MAYRLEYHVPNTPDNINLYFYHDYYNKQWWFESLARDTQRKRSVGFNADISLFEDAFDLSIGSNFWGEDQNTEWKDMFVQAKYNFSDFFLLWLVDAGIIKKMLKMKIFSQVLVLVFFMPLLKV